VEGKLMSDRIRWYLNFLRMNKSKIPKEVSNMKSKENSKEKG
jgi:hypothetical protein